MPVNLTRLLRYPDFFRYLKPLTHNSLTSDSAFYFHAPWTCTFGVNICAELIILPMGNECCYWMESFFWHTISHYPRLVLKFSKLCPRQTQSSNGRGEFKAVHTAKARNNKN